MLLSYRFLGPADAPAYRALRLECLRTAPEAFGSRYGDELHAETLKFDPVIQGGRPHDFLAGAFADGQLAGLCGFIRETRAKSVHRGDVSHMYCSLPGHGIGTGLLGFALSVAFGQPGLDVVTLGVVSGNEKAIRLYQNAGFTTYGQLDDYYRSDGQSWSLVQMVLTRTEYESSILLKNEQLLPNEYASCQKPVHERLPDSAATGSRYIRG